MARTRKTIENKGVQGFKQGTMSEDDFNRHVQDAANEFTARYGRDAARQAAGRAEELLAIGEHEGHRLWHEIYHAITLISGEGPDRPKH